MCLCEFAAIEITDFNAYNGGVPACRSGRSFFESDKALCVPTASDRHARAASTTRGLLNKSLPPTQIKSKQKEIKLARTELLHTTPHPVLRPMESSVLVYAFCNLARELRSIIPTKFLPSVTTERQVPHVRRQILTQKNMPSQFVRSDEVILLRTRRLLARCLNV